MRGNGVSVDPEELTSCSAALNRAISDAASGLQASRSDAESAAAGFPADLTGPFAAVNEYFGRVDSSLESSVAAAAARVLNNGASYCATDSAHADLLTGTTGGHR